MRGYKIEEAIPRPTGYKLILYGVSRRSILLVFKLSGRWNSLPTLISTPTIVVAATCENWERRNVYGNFCEVEAVCVFRCGCHLSTPARAEELTFGYVAGSLKNPYNVATADGFAEAAAKAGVRAIVLDPQGDVAKQGNAIDDLLAQGVDGIGFLPLDSVVAEFFVDKITEKGLPSAAIAVQVGDPNKRALKDVYPKLNALVTPDDFVAGEQGGNSRCRCFRRIGPLRSPSSKALRAIRRSPSAVRASGRRSMTPV